MIRYCISTATPVRAVQKPSGEWTAEGIAANNYIEQMQFTETFCRPYNVSFHLTSKAEECLNRLEENLTDSTSVFMPIDSISNYFIVPQPLFAGRLQYVTGYNVSDKMQDEDDSATVASNADLLDIEVYLWALFLLTSFITFIVIRVILLYSSGSFYLRMTLVQKIMKQLGRVFYQNSVRFRWITLLYTLLCFYMVTSFLCLYKTSHIIVEKPFYAKSYQESLDHPSSLAFYYDQFSVISTIFKNSPPDSLRGKMWAKLAATGRQDDYSGSAMNPANLPAVLKKGSEEMTVRRGICLAAPLIIPLIRSLACGFSPEDQLWIVKMIADPSEPEVIYGHAISLFNRMPRSFSVKMRSLFETHFLARAYTNGLNQAELAAGMVGTSKHHQWKQNVVCEDEDAFAVQPTVHAITLHYFRSFFTACLVVWLIAFLINTSHMTCLKRQSSSKTGGLMKRDTRARKPSS